MKKIRSRRMEGFVILSFVVLVVIALGLLGYSLLGSESLVSAAPTGSPDDTALWLTVPEM